MANTEQLDPRARLMEMLMQPPPDEVVANADIAPTAGNMGVGVGAAIADALQAYGRGLNPAMPTGNAVQQLMRRREVQANRDATAQNQKRRQEFIAKQNKARLALESIDRDAGRAQRKELFDAGQAAAVEREERASVRSAMQYAGTEGYDLSNVPKDANSSDYWRALQVQSKARREQMEAEGQARMTAAEISRLDDAEATIYDMLANMEGSIKSISEEEDPEAVRTNFTRTARRSLRKDPERFAEVMAEFEANVGVAIDAEIERRRVETEKIEKETAKRAGLGLLSSHADLYDVQPETPGENAARLMRLLDRQTIGGAFKQ